MTDAATKPCNPVMDFCKLCKQTEISELFAVWGGLSMVSATLGRSVWLDMGVFTVYPNLYVVLVAGSGAHRKSTVINLAESLIVVDPPVNFISTDLTPEALFKAMKRGERRIELPQGQVLRAEGTVVADELAIFLNKKSYERGIAPVLIRMFDCKSEMTKETIKDGKEKLTNVCLSILAGSTADLLRDAVPLDAVGSGLTSRMLFVYTDELPTPVPRPRLTPEDLERKASITKALQQIRRLEGPADLTPGAWDLYERSYIEHRKHPFVASPILSGYASRWHYHVLAISMIISASEHPLQRYVLVEEKHLKWAMAVLARSEVYMPRVMTLITSTEKGACVEMLAMYIGLAGETGVVGSTLLRGVSHRMSMRDYSEAISTLLASKRIEGLDGPEGRIYRSKKR
jgi:hypothetical protein